MSAYRQIPLHSGEEGANGSLEFEALETGPAAFYLNVTAVDGTDPTLDLVIQEVDPFSDKLYTVATFTQATGVTNEREEVADLPVRRYKAVWTIGGTDTPTVTFTLGAAIKDRG